MAKASTAKLLDALEARAEILAGPSVREGCCPSCGHPLDPDTGRTPRISVFERINQLKRILATGPQGSSVKAEPPCAVCGWRSPDYIEPRTFEKLDELRSLLAKSNSQNFEHGDASAAELNQRSDDIGEPHHADPLTSQGD